MHRRFVDDFNAANDGVLLLCVLSKIGFVRVLDVGCDEPGRIEDVAQPSKLVSFHRRKRPRPEYLHGRNGLGTFQGPPQDEIHRGANQFLGFTGHFEQFGCGNGFGVIKGHEQIHIAVRCRETVRRRAENVQVADAMLSAEGAKQCP